MDALLIAAGPPKLGGDKGELGEGGGHMDAKVRAAKRLMAADKAGNAVGYAKAWKDMYELCVASHGEGDDEPEEDEGEGNPLPDDAEY